MYWDVMSICEPSWHIRMHLLILRFWILWFMYFFLFCFIVFGALVSFHFINVKFVFVSGKKKNLLEWKLWRIHEMNLLKVQFKLKPTRNLKGPTNDLTKINMNLLSILPYQSSFLINVSLQERGCWFSLLFVKSSSSDFAM